MHTIKSLDLETSPTLDNPQEYALQPWRMASGESTITWFGLGDNQKHSVAVPYGKKTTEKIRKYLSDLAGERVWAWHAPFDIAWLIAAGFETEVRKIKWADGKLLWKWIEPDNMHGYHLAGATAKFLTDWEEYPLYLKLKEQEQREGYNGPNTALYNQLDCVATSMNIEKMWPELLPQQQRQFFIEQACLVDVAKSWLTGVGTDQNACHTLEPELMHTLRSSVEALGMEWDDEKYCKILNSPTQLRKLLYEDWEWPIQYYTDKGEPSTDKSALTYGSDHDDRALHILKYRGAKTALDKFVKGPIAAAEYNGVPISHSSPYLYSTYTGRMTYSSKLLRKFRVGIALHQWKRDKQYRRIITPPPGMENYELVEFDFSGQENRLMSEFAGPGNMRDVFVSGKDIHSRTGAEVGRMPYDEFIRLKEEKDERVAGPRGLRYQGKFLNLSCQYRIGVKSLRRKARIDYDMDVSKDVAYIWKETFLGLYPEVPLYWEDAIERAYEAGYAETKGGRRIYLPRFKFEDDESRWGAESRAINFPIQGTGADMKELGIAVMSNEFRHGDGEPVFQFAFDLHDGLFFWIPRMLSNSYVLEAKECLSNLPYKAAWGWDPAISLPVDAQRGPRWGELKEVK